MTPPRRLYTETEIVPASALFDLLLIILNERRTGSLTINFAGGKPDGTAEFKRRILPEELPLTTPSIPIP